MPVETLKYDFRFNREEAQVMLEVLEHWKKNFTSGLENPYDWKDRNRMETELLTTNILIKKITNQANTKKNSIKFYNCTLYFRPPFLLLKCQSLRKKNI